MYSNNSLARLTANLDGEIMTFGEKLHGQRKTDTTKGIGEARKALETEKGSQDLEGIKRELLAERENLTKLERSPSKPEALHIGPVFETTPLANHMNQTAARTAPSIRVPDSDIRSSETKN